MWTAREEKYACISIQIHQTQLVRYEAHNAWYIAHSRTSKWWIAARCFGPIYSWYLDLWSPASHVSKPNDASCSMADWSGAADVCLTNKRWPRETPSSRRLLIDLLLINSKTVWFMGKRTCGDSHLAWSRVLWMRGADPGGPKRLRFRRIYRSLWCTGEQTPHTMAAGVFSPTRRIQTTSASCVQVLLQVCAARVLSENVARAVGEKGSEVTEQD